MSVSPCPFTKFHLHDDNGNPATGWKLHSYKAGEDVQHPLFKDASGLVEHPNPLTLNARGEPDGDGVFLEDGQAYKLVLKRPDGSTAWSEPYVLTSSGGGSASPVPPLPGRTLYGNTATATAEPSAVPIADVVEENASSLPSTMAVFQAIVQALQGVLKNSGAQSLDGSLDASGWIDAAELRIAGASIADLFVHLSGHSSKCVVGSVDGSGNATDIPVVDVIDTETPGNSMPSVDAVRSFFDAAEAGLVRLSPEDALGYLPDKVEGDGTYIAVQVVGGMLRISLEGDAVGKAKPTASGTLGYVNDLFTEGDHVQLVKTDEGMQIAVPELTGALSDIESLEAADASLDGRVDALENAVRVKQVLFGGSLGATSVVIPHSLGTSDLCVSCYDTLANQLILINVTVSDTAVSISDLAPLEAANQIKVVLLK